MMDKNLDLHMPTGLTTLDPVFDGGIPPGSVVLLKGEIGSGKVEFAYSIMIFLSHLMAKGTSNENIVLPNEIRYICVTKSKESILREISHSFNVGLLTNLELVQFTDLSDIYFDTSLVPINWYTEYDNIIDRMSSNRQIHESLLTTLSYTLDGIEPKSLVIIDSLTEIATQYLSLIHI